MANKPYRSRGKRETGKRRADKRPDKSTSRKISFKIESVDPLGQGVSKDSPSGGKPTITFIAKTLPTEEGTARVLRQSKGVQFAQLETSNSITATAINRIKPECPHFDQCPACHYLHTDYQSELEYKQKALSEVLKHQDVSGVDFETIVADQRLHYRNRIQLHYRYKYIGMIDPLLDKIVEIPHCKVIRPELQNDFDKLYVHKEEWSQDHGATGHVEIYLQPDKVSVQWDQQYAHGGFTQVNQTMSSRLCKDIKNFMASYQFDSVLDLFSGDGNLSNELILNSISRRSMIDNSKSVDHPDYLELDLFAESALPEFKKQSNQSHFDVMLIDPPRKGFPLLAKWVKSMTPQHLVYVSCNAQSMARDLNTLREAKIKFTIDRLVLVDLFPGTYHFETIAYISFKFKKNRRFRMSNDGQDE